jgi:hypothetical protein
MRRPDLFIVYGGSSVQTTPEKMSELSAKRIRLERAVDAIIDLLDPDIEARSFGDAVNISAAIELAIIFVCARPEFFDLDRLEIAELHSRTLEQIGRQTPNGYLSDRKAAFYWWNSN